MSLAWNVVAKNIHPHGQLQSKLREKISKLERHLQHFPADAVHLHVALARNPRRGVFTAALTLSVPSNVLHSEKSAEDPIPALDQAVRALLRELASLKASLRREAAWKHGSRRMDHQEPQPARFAATPLPAGEGPQNLGDMVRRMVGELYPNLLEFIRRELIRAEMERGLPKHALDAEAVADEVARLAISRPANKPEDWSYRLWLYELARRELGRRCREFRERASSTIRLDASLERPHDPTLDEGYANGEPVSLYVGVDEAFEATGPDLPDGQHLTPDLEASESDLVDHLEKASLGWAPEERSLFELHFLEGFEPEEIAMLEGKRPAQVEKLVEQVQERLREAVTEAMQARVQVRGEKKRSDWTVAQRRLK